VQGDLTLRAMSLVYTTMLAIVPLLAFVFAVLKGLGVHRDLEPILQGFLSPLGPRAGELTDRIIEFVDNVSGSALASIGIVLLLYTALSMAQKVESSFNFVWRVDHPRSFARRVVSRWDLRRRSRARRPRAICARSPSSARCSRP
jgi:membrane protein